VLVWTKNFIGKEKLTAEFSIPLKDLAHLNEGDDKPSPEWFPVVVPQSKVLSTGGDVVIATQKAVSDEEMAAADATKDKKKKKVKKKPGEVIGHIRLQMYVQLPPVEKIVLPGIALNGEWCDGMNGGNIVGNPYWYENPQYLLVVGCKTSVTITLAQPNEHNTDCTFYVLQYDDSRFAGHRLPYFDKEDIVPIRDTTFLAPTFATLGLCHPVDIILLYVYS